MVYVKMVNTFVSQNEELCVNTPRRISDSSCISFFGGSGRKRRVKNLKWQNIFFLFSAVLKSLHDLSQAQPSMKRFR